MYDCYWRMASVAPNGRLSPLTAPTALMGKGCNGSILPVRHADDQ
jgi:hypothetical protein